MNKSMSSRQMCELILTSSDATPAEKRVAQVRLDELDAGDAGQLYVRLDADAAPPDRGAIVAAIKKLDPEFEDHESLSIDFLTGRLDQMRRAKTVSGTATTASSTARTDAHDGYMDGMQRTNTLARYEQQRQSAIAYCRGDAAAEKAAVARLDASIAHEAELAKYRAERSQETKLDSKTEQPRSAVVESQIEYYRRMRSLGNGGGNSAA